jgi:hypothetical protein
MGREQSEKPREGQITLNKRSREIQLKESYLAHKAGERGSWQKSLYGYKFKNREKKAAETHTRRQQPL